jgi:hypothetical protein
MDDEDQSIRDNLRTLVLAFVKEKMKKILSIIKDEPGSEPERILANGVLKVCQNVNHNRQLDLKIRLGYSQVKFFRYSDDSQGYSLVLTIVQVSISRGREDTLVCLG